MTPAYGPESTEYIKARLAKAEALLWRMLGHVIDDYQHECGIEDAVSAFLAEVDPGRSGARPEPTSSGAQVTGADTAGENPALGSNQCEHGSLRRQCEMCEMLAERDALRDVVASLEADHDECIRNQHRLANAEATVVELLAWAREAHADMTACWRAWEHVEVLGRAPDDVKP